MKRSADMQRLSEEIIVAYDLRITQLAELRRQTHAQLADAARERQAMADHQRAELEAYTRTLQDNTHQQLGDLREQRAASAEALRDDLRDFVEDLRSETHALVAGYQQERETMAAALRDDLHLYAEQLRTETQALVAGYQQEREQIATAQREQLRQHRHQLASDVQAMLGDLQADHRRNWRSWKAVLADVEQLAGSTDTDVELDTAVGTVEDFIQDADEFVRRTRSTRRRGSGASEADAEPSA